MPKSMPAELAKKSFGSLTRPEINIWESSIARDRTTPHKKSFINFACGKINLAK
jgi:hypothetical protein